ncbi:MAG TPA: sigma-70 family RNA polymerase sigma factor [Candidatus Acidoferrales bacterium]|nr:sigma-70 family RNA polymerase sigma factor [Candidatus Acidoferrales bacterium]
MYPLKMDATDGIELAGLRAQSPSEAGSPERLEDVFRAEYPRLVGLTMRVTGDRGQAEEVVSEAFYRLSRRPELFRPRNNISGWLYRTAMNLGLNALKMEMCRKRRENAAALEASRGESDGTDALDELIGREKQLRVRRALGSIRSRSAQLLLLHHAGFSYRELAETLNLNPASVGQLLLRATAEFKKEFMKHGEGRQ